MAPDSLTLLINSQSWSERLLVMNMDTQLPSDGHKQKWIEKTGLFSWLRTPVPFTTPLLRYEDATPSHMRHAWERPCDNPPQYQPADLEEMRLCDDSLPCHQVTLRQRPDSPTVSSCPNS